MGMENALPILEFEEKKNKLGSFCILPTEKQNEQKEIEQKESKEKEQEPTCSTPVPKTKPAIGKVSLTPLMQRLASFLPKMKQANEELQKVDSKKYNIEDEDESGEQNQIIEVNLGLGVFESKKASGEEKEEETLKELKFPSGASNWTASDTDE